MGTGREQTDSWHYISPMSNQLSVIRHYAPNSLTMRKRLAAWIVEYYETFLDTMVYLRKLPTLYGIYTMDYTAN